MSDKNQGFSLAYTDMLFNLLIGFVTLFILSFIFINPPKDTGMVDPVTQFMVFHTWNDESDVDMDIWISGPSDTIVGYPAKEGGYMQLDRDDLGSNNDTYMVDGKPIVVKRNIETITINDIVPGDYYISVNFFGPNEKSVCKCTEISTVELVQMHPYKILFAGNVEMGFVEEKSVIGFHVTETGDVVNIITNPGILVKQTYTARKLKE